MDANHVPGQARTTDPAAQAAPRPDMTGGQPDDHDGYFDERSVWITYEGRARMRRRLDELDAKWTPERSAASRAQLRQRLLEVNPGLAEQFAREDAEEVAPPLRWRRLAEEAARHVTQIEQQQIEPEGVAMFREIFDEALREAHRT
ncbi:hypothetical protein [Dactylosporangium sp. NPDC051484]|uniref:hypothetical protein n=1 Tax=Dactylosporangium sp. NPDC051484 TaxID=3154942 RepID=UPI00344D9C91